MRSAIVAGLLASASALSIPMPRDADLSLPPQSVFYFLVNKKDAASIVAVDSRPNANQFISTPTGGKGESVRNPAFPDQDIQMDVLQSAFSVIVDKNTLFTVNAGSGTAVMFNINPLDPLHPKMVGKPASSGGDFPMSIAYNSKINKACVLNAGTRNGVQCYSVDPLTGLKPEGAFRSLGFTMGPIPTFNNGSSAISFNDDGSLLFVSNKAGPMVVYPVKNGQVSQTGVSTTIPDMKLPFGHKFVGQNTVFVADPSFGGSLVTIDKATNKLTEGPHTDEFSPVDILDMSCWAVNVPKHNRVYTTDADRAHFGVYDSKTGALIKVANFTDSNPEILKGGFDSLLDNRDGKTIWFQARDNIIASYDTDSEKNGDIIVVDPAFAGARHYWQGLAQWTLLPKY